MALYKFRQNEIAINKLRTHPHHRVLVHAGKTYINNTTSSFIMLGDQISGSQPFVTKDGSRYSFKTTTDAEYMSKQYGENITGSYPMSCSYGFEQNASTTTMDSLRAVFDSYNALSPRYQFSSSAHGPKRTVNNSLISMPQLHYGSGIKKRSIKCRIYMTGSLVGELQDIYGNGELIQVGPKGSTGSGSVAGVALYKEGFLYLTGGWALSPSTDEYGSGNTDNTKWKYFGSTVTPTKTAMELEYDGTEEIPTMTMYADAPKGELNCSTNLTSLQRGQTALQHTSSVSYIENNALSLVNMTYSPHGASGSFEKTTYISSIGIYDEDENLVAIGKLATPIKKRQKDGYTFKLKLDL